MNVTANPTLNKGAVASGDLASDCQFYVHIQGPDELRDMPSKAEAIAAAEKLNALFAKWLAADPTGPEMKAVVGFCRG